MTEVQDAHPPVVGCWLTQWAFATAGVNPA